MAAKGPLPGQVKVRRRVEEPKAVGDDTGDPAFGGLTEKQREVLDLLIEHKTSKEIARLLGISPHTVDQRISFAREKLGAGSRSEVAMAYRRLVSVSGRTTYQKTHIAAPAHVTQRTSGSLAGQVLGLRSPELARPDGTALTELDYRVVPELFDGRYGTLVRLGAVISIAVFLVILVLGGLAIFSQLSEMMAT
jgi:DNA-binding CsgD family transcriptional regulator